MSLQLRFWTCPEPGQLTCAAQVDWATCKRLPSSFAPLTRSANRYQFSGYPHRIFSIFWASQAPPRGKPFRWLDRKLSHRLGAKKRVLELDREISGGDGSKEIRWGLHGPWQKLPGRSTGLGTHRTAYDARGGMGGALGVLGVGYAGRSQRRMRRVNRSAARLSCGDRCGGIVNR